MSKQRKNNSSAKSGKNLGGYFLSQAMMTAVGAAWIALCVGLFCLGYFKPLDTQDGGELSIDDLPRDTELARLSRPMLHRRLVEEASRELNSARIRTIVRELTERAPTEDGERLLFGYLEQWGRSEPKAAIAFVRTTWENSEERVPMISKILDGWVVTATDEAWNWATKNYPECLDTSKTAGAGTHNLIAKLSRISPETALQQLDRRVHSDESKREVLEGVLGCNNLDSIKKPVTGWILSQPESLRSSSMKLMMKKLMEQSNQDALQWLTEADVSMDEKQAHLASAVHEWSRGNPSATLHWILTNKAVLAEPGKLISTAIDEWVERKPEQVRAWMIAQEPDPLLDHSRVTVAYKAFQDEPENGLLVARTIFDKGRRREVLADMESVWKKQDPAGFRKRKSS